MDSAAIAASSPSSHFTKLRNPSPPPTSRLNFAPFKSSNRVSLHSSRNPSSSSPSFSCRIATTPPSSPFQTNNHAKTNLDHIISEFQSLSSPLDRLNRLLHYSTLLPPLDDAVRTDSNRVMGCTARVWLEVIMDSDGKMRFQADSDSEITRGFCYCLIRVVEGMGPEEVLDLRTEDLRELSGVVGGLVHGGSNSRVNTWGNVLIGMQKRTKGLVAQREGKEPCEAFPSLVVTAEGIEAKGCYAEAQVRDS